MNLLSKSVVGNISKVSMNITKHLLSKPNLKERNVVLSPLSIQTTLGMVTAGSEGSTQRQLLSFLGSKSIDDLNFLSSHLLSSVLKDAAPSGGPRLSIANAVWFQQNLSLYPSFQKIVANDYMATLESLDFINKADEAIGKVNSWAAEKTNRLITRVLSRKSLDPLTRLIFSNVLYFKGKWDQQFDTSITKDYDFHLLNGKSVKVPFMTNMDRGERHFISVFDGFKVLRLPYEQGLDKRQFSMYFFLPDAKDGLLSLIEKVASEHETLEDIFPNTKVNVGDFRIPSFEVSFDLELSNDLKELGVVLPFSVGGLTKMVDSPIHISNITQYSLIKVNEEGSEAAAVTLTHAETRGRVTRTTPIDFVADHPFLFLIREDLSGTILFAGQVLKP